MKKMIAFMLACCVAFGATACSNTNTNKPEPAKQEETQDNANNTEIQEDDIADETTERAKFDITGDTFITLLNTQLKNSPLKLENIEEKETEDGNAIHYTANNNDISIQYEVDKKTNDLLMVALSINDITDKDKISDFKEYFIRIRLIIDIDANAETLFSELHINNFEVSSLFDYNSSNVQYTKVVSVNDDLSYIYMTPARKEAQDNDISSKTERKISEFDVTGDEFIKVMNAVLEATYPDLVLTNFKPAESEDSGEKQLTYYTIKNNVFVGYRINKDSNNVCHLYIIIKDDDLNEDTHFNASIYFMTAISALHLNAELDDLIENLNMADYTSKTDKFYETDEATYIKSFVDDSFSFAIGTK